MRTVRILAAAAEEAAEAAAWYAQEHPGLGIEFERAIDGVLDLLEQDIVPLTSMPGVAGKRGVKRLMLIPGVALAMIQNKPADPLDVCLLGADTVVFSTDNVANLLQQPWWGCWLSNIGGGSGPTPFPVENERHQVGSSYASQLKSHPSY